jgi:hypothetical protein
MAGLQRLIRLCAIAAALDSIAGFGHVAAMGSYPGSGERIHRSTLQATPSEPARGSDIGETADPRVPALLTMQASTRRALC